MDCSTLKTGTQVFFSRHLQYLESVLMECTDNLFSILLLFAVIRFAQRQDKNGVLILVYDLGQSLLNMLHHFFISIGLEHRILHTYSIAFQKLGHPGKPPLILDIIQDDPMEKLSHFPLCHHENFFCAQVFPSQFLCLCKTFPAYRIQQDAVLFLINHIQKSLEYLPKQPFVHIALEKRVLNPYTKALQCLGHFITPLVVGNIIRYEICHLFLLIRDILCLLPCYDPAVALCLGIDYLLITDACLHLLLEGSYDFV